MNNKERLNQSAKTKSLYQFFKGNSFLVSEEVKLKPNYSKGKESPWSLSFAGHCLKDVFAINNPVFCAKYAEAISGDGQEANKITTLHSSSLASLLLFYSVSEKNPIYFMINNQLERFTESRFEVKNEVHQGSNNYSNVDVVLYGDNCILYLESKFSEYLGSGAVEVREVDYYDRIYDRLSATLKEAGLHLVNKDGKRYLDSIDGKTFYCEGIKQMISHFLGVSTEIITGRINNEGKRIVLGEIFFNFGDKVPRCNKKYNSYKDAYATLKEGLQHCAEEDKSGLLINDLTTYQCVLGIKQNEAFLNKLPDRVREFYCLNCLL